MHILELYSDYLLVQHHFATATGLAQLLKDELSHDQVTRFLHKNNFSSKELWTFVKPTLKKYQHPEGVLIIDDSIIEKPHTDENQIVAWHFDHAKARNVKGINILSAFAQYEQINLPIAYELVTKPLLTQEQKRNKERRKSNVTKNELFRRLVKQAKANGVEFKYVLADSWYCSKENMEEINSINKQFIMGIHSNRLVASSKEDKAKGKYVALTSLPLSENEGSLVWLKGVSFPVKLVKRVYKNGDKQRGVLYLVSNAIELSDASLCDLYQKRWKIEEYHKSIKQNTSISKSPTRKEKSQLNHIYSSLVSYCKLEFLKVSQGINHYGLRIKLLYKANEASWKELARLKEAGYALTMAPG